jgi:anti-sigma factor RsiW
MTIAREVILDLLPLYLAGEGSPATRALVEEHLRQDPELARLVEDGWKGDLPSAASSTLPPELELTTIRRTKRLLAWQRWLFGLGIGFSAIALTSEATFGDGRLKEFHLLIQEYPAPFGACLTLAFVSWIAYSMIRRRLRVGG